MVAVKAQDRQRFIEKLPANVSVIVVYGPDAGLVSETARETATRLAKRQDPPGEILRIEDGDLDDDPDRLLVELQTIPMFGGGKVIRTTTGRRVNINMLKPVLEGQPPAAALVIEAGNLKPTDALRKLSEKADFAAAVPCFADSTQDLARMVDDMLAKAGKTIDPDAKSLLVARLGSDRALSRSEVDKLILSVGERTLIDEAAVLDAVGDVSELSLDRVVLAALDGQSRPAVEALERAVAAGQAYQGILLALQRHLLLLHRLRAGVETGKRTEEVIKSLRAPVHFKMRDALTRQCRNWSLPALNHALRRTQATIKATRGGPQANVESAATERLLIDLSRLAHQR